MTRPFKEYPDETLQSIIDFSILRFDAHPEHTDLIAQDIGYVVVEQLMRMNNE